MKQRKGLSLIELLIALAVFAIMGTAVTGIFVQGLQVRRQNQLNAQAQAYANLVLEQYKSYWSNVQYYQDGAVPSLPDAPKGFNIDLMNQLKLDDRCLDASGSEISCDTRPPLREVSVQLIDIEGTIRADLVTEIGNPRP